MIDTALIITLSCFFAFLISYLLLDYMMSLFRKKTFLAKRLSGLAPEVISSQEKIKLFQKKRSGLIEKKLHNYLTHFKSENWFQLQLYRSGLSFSLTQSAFIGLALVLLTTYLMTQLVFWHILTIFFTSCIGVIFFTWLVLSILKDRRQKQIIKHLPEAIDVILRALKSGYSVEKTFVVVAKEMHASIAGEFGQIVQQMNIGVSYEAALRLASERVHTSDFYFLSNALIIQRQTGGSLSETLENILFLLYRRHEIRLKTLSLSAEAKATGIILGSVPIAIWFIIIFLKPEYMDFFLYDEMGSILLKTVVGLLILEALVIKWLTNIKVE